MTRIPINPELYQALVSASELSGRPVTSLVDEALEEFIECNAETLMEQGGLSEVDRQAEELFGDVENPPDDEGQIIFSKDLTHPEKLQALAVLRAKKRDGVATN